MAQVIAGSSTCARQGATPLEKSIIKKKDKTLPPKHT
jgi:hypothetical protein